MKYSFTTVLLCDSIHAHTHCHTYSLSSVSMLRAVQQSICCYLSACLYPLAPLSLPFPFLSVPFNHSLGSLVSFVPLLPTNHNPTSLFSAAPPLHPPPRQQHRPSCVDDAVCPRGSWDAQAHGKYTAKNSLSDEPFYPVASQPAFFFFFNHVT